MINQMPKIICCVAGAIYAYCDANYQDFTILHGAMIILFGFLFANVLENISKKGK